MSCNCNQLSRVLYYPVTELDKLEYQLVEQTGYNIRVQESWKEHSFLSAYSQFNPASQCVLMAHTLNQLGVDPDEWESLCFLAKISYPLVTSVLGDWEIDPDILNKAMANKLTDKELLDWIDSRIV